MYDVCIHRINYCTFMLGVYLSHYLKMVIVCWDMNRLEYSTILIAASSINLHLTTLTEETNRDH